MHILYLDESGNENDPADKHFVLAGAALFETQAFFLAQELDSLQVKYFPGAPPVEFHASQIRSGKDFWRKVQQSDKDGILNGIAAAIANAPNGRLVLFAAVIEKTDKLYGEDAVKTAAEQICKKFDTF